MTTQDNPLSVVFGPGLSGLSRIALDSSSANGWHTSTAASNEAAGRSHAKVVVLQGRISEGESAMLTAAKLRLTHPETRVVILGPETMRRSTDHLGVTLLPCNASVPQILGLIAS